MIDKLTSFLKEEKILPVSDKTWTTFKIDHCYPSDEQTRNEQYRFIKGQVEDKSGIYIYIKNGDYLYIGKAKF